MLKTNQGAKSEPKLFSKISGRLGKKKKSADKGIKATKTQIGKKSINKQLEELKESLRQVGLKGTSKASSKGTNTNPNQNLKKFDLEDFSKNKNIFTHRTYSIDKMRENRGNSRRSRTKQKSILDYSSAIVFKETDVKRSWDEGLMRLKLNQKFQSFKKSAIKFGK